MKRAAVIQHVAFEDLGTLAPLLIERGFHLSYSQAGVDDLTVHRKLPPDLLVVLGGPIGAYDEAAYPFLSEELAVIEQQLAEGRPTLGICLGAQLIARALGAIVQPMQCKEIGFATLQLTGPGRDSVLAEMLEETPVLHWHGDAFEVPGGAQSLASTDACPNQAFAVGEHVLGLQFHLEADVSLFERWLIGHAGELAAAAISPSSLRRQARVNGASLHAASTAVFGAWLDRIDQGIKLS